MAMPRPQAVAMSASAIPPVTVTTASSSLPREPNAFIRPTTKATRHVYMIGPPALKLWMKKFLSTSLTSGVALGLGEALAAGVPPAVVVVAAGDIPETVALTIGLVAGAVVEPGAAGLVAVAGAVAGDIAGAVAGDVTGAVAGLVAVVGGAPGGLAGEVGGGWPNEVSARVTEKRLAISVVFIGLIRAFDRPRIPMSGVSS